MLLEDERLELKAAVDSYGRLNIAVELGMPYATLTGKLNGYCSLTDGEIQRIEAAFERLGLGQ